ncbi:unnamed protein product [Prunus brigantina]
MVVQRTQFAARLGIKVKMEINVTVLYQIKKEIPMLRLIKLRRTRLPFSDSSLKPIFRARTVSDAPPFDPSNIVSLQAHFCSHFLLLMFSKFEFDGKLNPTFVEGAFKLPLSSIRAYLKEPITPRISLLVFRVVLEKGEDLVRESGVPYTIVRPCALTEEPAGQISSPNCTCYVYQEIRLCYDVVKKMRIQVCRNFMTLLAIKNCK